MKSQIIQTGKQKFTRLFREKWVTAILSLGMIVLTVGVLGYLLFRQREVLFTYSWKLNWIPLIGALVIHGGTLLIGAWVWADMISVLGPKLDFRQHLRFFCLNMLARRLPGTIWYVFYRAQAYNRYGFSVQITTIASGMELAVGVVSGIVTTFLFAIPILIRLHFSPWVLIPALLGCAGFLNPPVLQWVIRKFSKEPVQIQYQHLMKWILMYIVLWVLGGIILFLMINFFYPLPFSQISYVIGAWVLVGTASQALVFLPSNFGFGEASLSLLLSQVIPSSLAVIIAVATRIIFIVFEIFWSALSLLFLRTPSR